MAAARNDKQRALRLYVWNARLCETFYLPIQIAEVAARNAVLKPLGRRFGQKWYEDPRLTAILPPRLEQELEDAVDKERRRHGGSLSSGHVVSALSLGFWVALMGTSYSNHLWHNGIRGSFPNATAAEDQVAVHVMLDDMRKLRNDIMHHSAIFDRKPQLKMANVMKIISLVSFETHSYVNRLNRLQTVLNERPSC
ncbi:Abi family protein [Rhizobium leguminosarum]|uniref:Abi family protein n=1 Tax=Rhizobium leguminosarum TaxID=384 RepID=UPI0015FC9B2D|nr:Abi family protein [Rhizobium leguminosarum]MBA8836474.1 hypothetical protein [Rhizobium leguminosarum]